MSLALLSEVEREARRLLIAGSELAAGDFRLKKLLPPIKKAGEKAPVFARVAAQIEQVIESQDESVSDKLLELANIAMAILYTQGEIGLQGEMEDIETFDWPLMTDVPYSKLQPVLEALVSKGAGRLEIIRNAQENNVYHDLRTILPLYIAQDDSYAEIADLASAILAKHGPMLVPFLVSVINRKGGKGDARRLELLYLLAGRKKKKYYIRALQNGSPEIKISAIKILGKMPECELFLFEPATAKKKEIREAAFLALADSESEKAVEILVKSFHGADRDIVAAAFRKSTSKAMRKALLEDAEQYFSLLTANKDKIPKAYAEHFAVILNCLEGNKDIETVAFLKKCLSYTGLFKELPGGYSGYQAQDSIADIIARNLLILGTNESLAMLEAARDLDEYLLSYAFEAAILKESAENVFEGYAGYMKKGKKAAMKKLLQVMERYVDFTPPFQLNPTQRKYTLWDSRWLPLIINADALSLVCRLSAPDEACIAYLLERFEKHAQINDNNITEITLGLIQAGYPKIMNVVTRVLEGNLKRTGYYTYYLTQYARVLGLMPLAFADDLEAIAIRYRDDKKDEKAAEILMEAVCNLKNKGR